MKGHFERITYKHVRILSLAAGGGGHLINLQVEPSNNPLTELISTQKMLFNLQDTKSSIRLCA